MRTLRDVQRLPLTANFHFIKSCNYRCGFCYATFADVAGRPVLPEEQLFKLTELLARRYTKVSLVGGEPTLYPGLKEMLAIVKREGALTNLVTNGSRIDAAWLEANAHVLDLLTISIDSADSATLRAVGRATPRGDVLTSTHFVELAQAARRLEIGLKINTVVTTLNEAEDMADLIRDLAPERWKILQAAPVEGQNDELIDELTPTMAAFNEYVDGHAVALIDDGIRIVAEPIDVIRGSYIMVDPQGRFFDSTAGTHHYSSPILKVGLDTAFAEVEFDPEKFLARDGDADFDTRKAA